MKSRKMWMTVLFGVLIIMAGAVLPEAAVGDAVAGLVTLCLGYVGGNTATKWVLGRAAALATPKSSPPPSPQKPAGA